VVDILEEMRQYEADTIQGGEYDASTIVRDIADVAIDRKASDVTILDIGKSTTLADYFLIVTGTSDRQINAVANAVEERMKELGVRRIAREGLPADGWVLLDYGQIIVHVFAPEQREYYDLERRWSDAPTLLKVQ
jgi:ribosome-associated protein